MSNHRSYLFLQFLPGSPRSEPPARQCAAADPAPLSCGFISRWYGVGRRQAWEARRELLEAGIIRQAGTCGSGALFLPVDPQATESRRGGVRVAHAMVV